MVTLPEGFHDLLHEKKALAHLATLLPDGSPHVTPVWFDVCNGKIRVNTVKGRVKARNMLRDTRVALSIVDPDNPDRHIQIRGLVTRVTGEGAVVHNNTLARKYYGLDAYPWDKPGDEHLICEIEPIAVQTLG